jgi:hypothetical protein
MSYTSNAAAYISFNSSPFLENVSGNLLTPNASPYFANAVFGQGWSLSNNFLEANILNGLSSQFSIGFWFKSSNPGSVRNPTTNAVEPLLIPVMSKCNFYYYPSYNFTYVDQISFIMWEETQTNGKNIMCFFLQGFTQYSIYFSQEYDPTIFHHFWFAYNGSTNSISLFIDAIQDYGIIYGSVPSYMNQTPAPFGINYGMNGQNYQIMNSQGIINDLIVLNTCDTSGADLYRVMNYGAEYIIDTSLINVDEISQAFIFDDKSTIQTTSIVGSGGNMYIGRSDGTIIKGSRSLWQSRRNFSNPDEQNDLSIITQSLTNNFSINNGILNIQNAIVRI